MKLPCHAVIFCLIRSHRHAIAVFPAALAFHHKNLDFIPHGFVIHITHSAICQKHIVQTFQTIDITGTHEDDNALRVIGTGLLTAVLIKGKDRLRHRIDHFFWRKIRLLIVDDLIYRFNLLIADQSIRLPHTSVMHMHRCINMILFFQLLQDLIHISTANPVTF